MTRNELKEFLNLALRFRRTPIVDDDFPSLRDQFDGELARLIEELQANDAVIDDQAWGVPPGPGEIRVRVINNKVMLRLGSITSVAELTAGQARRLAIELEVNAMKALQNRGKK